MKSFFFFVYEVVFSSFTGVERTEYGGFFKGIGRDG